MYKFKITLYLYDGSEEIVIANGKYKNFFDNALCELEEIFLILYNRNDFEEYSFEEIV